MNEPTIALVFTPDPWVEELHRHCTDHGGARVRQVLIDPALVLEEQYDVLVVSHRWSALTRGLVDDVHARGRAVLGVFDRDEPAGHDLLVAAGADATVASDGGPAGIIGALRGLRGDGTGESARRTAEPEAVRGGAIVAVSGPAGAGATEVAIALAAASRGTVLVDADDVAPAVAPRLGLPLEPNVRTAVDAVEHDGEDPAGCLVTRGALRVLVGLPSAATWAQVRPTELLRLLDRLAAGASRVAVNVAGTLEDIAVPMARPRHGIARAVLAEAGDVVAVGSATPVGVTRLIAWIADARALAPRARLHVVLNRAPKDAFRCRELAGEVEGSFGVASVAVAPYDRRVDMAGWNGVLVGRGPFTRSIAQLAGALEALRAAS
jgi:hypothetical protein